MKTGVELIAIERQRQIEEEGWTPKHDAQHTMAQLRFAAMCYTSPCATSSSMRKNVPPDWPWDKKWWKPSKSDVRNLVKAGALIAAEIDRIRNAQK